MPASPISSGSSARSLLGSIFSALVFYSAANLLHGSWLDGFPRSFWVIEALVAVAILGGVRFAIRAASDLPAAAAAATTDGLPTLLYGAGRTGVMLARSAQRNPGLASARSASSTTTRRCARSSSAGSACSAAWPRCPTPSRATGAACS